MRVLFLSRWLPYPPDNGARIRIYNLLRELAVEHAVSLLAFEERPERVTEASVATLRAVCADVEVLPYRPFQPTRARALAGLLSPQPRSLVDTHSPQMAAAIAAAVQRQRPDVVVASEVDMLPYALADTLRDVPAVLEDLELARLRDALRAHPGQSLARRSRASFTWLKLRAYLRRALPRFAVCTVVSEPERALVRALAPHYKSVVVLPNAVALAEYVDIQAVPEPGSLVYAGAFAYDANFDAARFFLAEVFPRVRQAMPGATIRLTGDPAGRDLGALVRQPGVILTGHVPDVRPVVAGSWVSVVPLRVGGGTRLKILEAMALGTPVVATAKGAEGLDARDGEHLLLADSPEVLARRVVDLLRSPDERARLAASGRRLVAERYDWAVVGRQVRAVVQQAAARPASLAPAA